jgi:hypothetical protein
MDRPGARPAGRAGRGRRGTSGRATRHAGAHRGTARHAGAHGRAARPDCSAHCRADKDNAGSGLTNDFEASAKARVNGRHTQFRTLVRTKAIAYANQDLLLKLLPVLDNFEAAGAAAANAQSDDARAIQAGLRANRARISFPFLLAFGCWWLAVLPAGISWRLLRALRYVP